MNTRAVLTGQLFLFVPFSCCFFFLTASEPAEKYFARLNLLAYVRVLLSRRYPPKTYKGVINQKNKTVMTIQKLVLTTMITLAVSAMVLTGCKKDDDQDDNDTSATSDNAFAEATYQDVASIADEASRSNSLSNFRNSTPEGLLSSCATITRDTLNNSNVDTITVDFGTANCTCADGRNRRGKIIINYTGHYRDSLTTINITFDNYFVNDNQVMGTHTIINQGHNAAGHLIYNITVNGQIILANSAGTITWTTNKVREWTAGESTAAWSDDMYSITGSASGTGANGQSFTATVTSPLIRNMALGCRRHFVQGTAEITPSNKPTRTIDFGNGTCDDIATVTINGNTYTVHLH
jgi:hypothetical protein